MIKEIDSLLEHVNFRVRKSENRDFDLNFDSFFLIHNEPGDLLVLLGIISNISCREKITQILLSYF